MNVKSIKNRLLISKVTIVSGETVVTKKVEESVYIQEALRHSALGKPIMTNSTRVVLNKYGAWLIRVGSLFSLGVFTVQK